MNDYLLIYEKFRSRLDRKLSENEKVFLQWIYAQHLLEQRVSSSNYS